MNIYYCYWIDTSEEFSIFGYSYIDAICRARLEEYLHLLHCAYIDYAD